jgi:hypothetical protein
MEVSGHLYTPVTLPVGEVTSIIISPTAEVWMFIMLLVSLSLVKNAYLGM